jgi:hypothetical protein
VARNTPKSRRDFHDLDFDGDDLQLDDFLTVNDRSSKPKHYSKPKFQPNDEMDWFSIDTTPSPPQRGTKVSNPPDDEWAADMGDQEDENPEPVRLANGKWACNHRCKDKTRFARSIAVFKIRLTVSAASISAAEMAWTKLRSLPKSGPSLLSRRRMASIN